MSGGIISNLYNDDRKDKDPGSLCASRSAPFCPLPYVFSTESDVTVRTSKASELSFIDVVQSASLLTSDRTCVLHAEVKTPADLMTVHFSILEGHADATDAPSPSCARRR